MFYNYLYPRNDMRLFFLFFSLLMFSACSTTPEVSPSHEKKSTHKILSNQSDAEEAKNEYKALQKQRTIH